MVVTRIENVAFDLMVKTNESLELDVRNFECE